MACFQKFADVYNEGALRKALSSLQVVVLSLR
jgi:hypothetical protein